MVCRPIFLAALAFSVSESFGQTDRYIPYRFVDKWLADTLYLGPSFSYPGTTPIRVSLQFSESASAGRLYIVNPASDDTAFLMTNREPIGTTLNVSDLLSFPAGGEVIFMYISEYDNVPRFSGPSRPESKYFNRITSDNNLNPLLRFGRRLSVAGRVRPGLLEFGFEDSPQSLNIADMDFNDVHFLVEGLDLLIYAKAARKRAYIW